MAKRFVDCGAQTEVGSIANQDGTALTLTNAGGVRVLFDNAVPKPELYAALEKAKLAIIGILE